MSNALFLIVAGACFVAAIYKARSAWRNWTPDVAALCLTLAALGLALGTLAPAIQEFENLLVPNLGRLLSNSFTLAAACTTLVMLLHLNYGSEGARRQTHPRLAGLVVAVAVMSATFALAPLQSPPPEGSVGTFADLYDTEPTLVVYILTFTAYLGVALTDLLRMALRYARHTQGALRVGLRLVSIGSVLGTVYLAEKIAFIASQWSALPPLFAARERACTTPFTPASCAFSVGLPAVAVATFAIGATLPVWGPRLRAPAGHIRTRRSFQRLYPLWAELYDAAPEVMLTSPAALGNRLPAGISFRLYRRVIEIRDAWLALRPLRDPRVAEAADVAARRAGLDERDRRATVEAAVLIAAVQACRAGRDPHTQPGASLEPVPGPDSPDLAAEITWLERVAHAFACSTLARLAAQAPLRRAGES